MIGVCIGMCDPKNRAAPQREQYHYSIWQAQGAERAARGIAKFAPSHSENDVTRAK